jgi:hypothetical protein
MAAAPAIPAPVFAAGAEAQAQPGEVSDGIAQDGPITLM